MINKDRVHHLNEAVKDLLRDIVVTKDQAAMHDFITAMETHVNGVKSLYRSDTDQEYINELFEVNKVNVEKNNLTDLFEEHGVEIVPGSETTPYYHLSDDNYLGDAFIDALPQPHEHCRDTQYDCWQALRKNGYFIVKAKNVLTRFCDAGEHGIDGDCKTARLRDVQRECK